jgi:hypothetical protein
VATPADRNVNEADDKLNCKSLCVEIQGTWNMKCIIIPVVIGVTGTLTEKYKEKRRSHTRKTLNRFAAENSCIWNITHNTESTAV